MNVKFHKCLHFINYNKKYFLNIFYLLNIFCQVFQLHQVATNIKQYNKLISIKGGVTEYYLQILTIEFSLPLTKKKN